MALKNKKSTTYNKKLTPQLKDLVLPATKLKFHRSQLENLNFLFRKKIEDLPPSTNSTFAAIAEETLPMVAKSVCERLVQRLVCCASKLDARFSTKFLVHLNETNDKNSLQYLIRIDTLSTPSVVRDKNNTKPIPGGYSVIEDEPDFPQGYARIRIKEAALAEEWGQFCNKQGYLRRDKIQEKYVQLLSLAASKDFPASASDLDDSQLCASPGKVVDPFTLHQINKYPSSGHIYFAQGVAGASFPDPRDFRFSIVDEPEGIRIRLEFLSPTLAAITMNVRLLMAIETSLWPHSTDFPQRIPLGHADALLYNEAAQTGAYLVGYGVQSSAFQVRFPAAETVLVKNYSPESTVRQLLTLSQRLVAEIYEESAKHQKYQYSYKILNFYSFKTLVLSELEAESQGPTGTLLNWSPLFFSTHILRILDTLVKCLKMQRLPNYFYPKANLFANPGHLCEDDYLYESKRVHALMVQFYHLGMTKITQQEFHHFAVVHETETLLLCKWKDFVDSLLPPITARGRKWWTTKIHVRTQYTPKQLELLAILLKTVRHVSRNRIPTDDFGDVSEAKSSTLDLVFMVELIATQAKSQFLDTCPVGKEKKFLKKLGKHFDATLAFITKTIKDIDEDILDDADFAKVLLKWLHRIVEQNKRLLGPLLAPYMNTLFVSLHANSWFLDDVKERRDFGEPQALCLFATLINQQHLSPALGLVECVQKGWIWARNFLEVIKKRPVTVVLTPSEGPQHSSVSHLMSVPPETASRQPRNDVIQMFNNIRDIKDNENQDSDGKAETLNRKNYFCTILKDKNLYKHETNTPWHCVLRDNSPMTMTFRQLHRNGDHRCNGDIIQTLLSMHKLNILNEVASSLPPDDSTQLVKLLHQYNAERRKKSTIRKRHNTSSTTTPKMANNCDDYQKYTKLNDSA